MKECKKCGKKYDESFIVCEDCKTELVFEEKFEYDNANASVPVVEKTFCVYCGEEIKNNNTYCSSCGSSTIEEGKKHCLNCGNPLVDKQKFCAKCGSKATAIVPNGISKVAKKVNKKKILLVIAIVVVLIVVGVVGFNTIPKLFISSEKYLEQGNYVKAYEKAKEDNKNDVLFENLIANLSEKSKESLKNPDSFRLKDVWYDEEAGDIVMDIQGTNSYGGTISSYWLYMYSEEDEEYQLYTTVSDFDEEEIYSWDDTADAIEKILDNAAKRTVKEIISVSNNKIDENVVKRINGLNDSKLLENIELLDEINTIYPEPDSEA